MSKFFTVFIALCIIVAVGASGYYLFQQSIRLDEAQSLWISTKPVSSILFFTAQDVHVPLYSLLLHFWIQIFGNDIVFARILSFTFFILTLPVLYLVGKEASSKKIALLTVVLFAVSPFILWYSSEARMYTLFTLVTSFNHLFFLRMSRSDGKNGKAGYFLSSVVGFHTHYFFLFLVITQIMFVLYRLVSQISTEGNSIFSALKLYKYPNPWKYFLTLGTAAIFFVPWIVYFVSQGSASNTQPLIPPPNEYNILQTFVNFIFGFQSQAIQALLISLWPLSVVSLFFIFTQKNKSRVRTPGYFIITSFIPIALVFFVSFFRPIFLSRYLIFVTPTLFFLIAWMLLSYSRKISTLLVSWLLIGMMGLMFYQNFSEKTPVKENYEGVAKYLSANATARDVIAVSAPFTVYPIEYSYKGVARITTIPEWNRFEAGVIPPFSGENLSDQIEKYSDNYARVFVVLSYDQGYEEEIREYLDNNREVLTYKEFSPDLEVRVYRLRYDIEVN